MGMSIDEHIGVIEDLKSTMSVCMPEPEKTEICTSLSEAIETMRKYQKIEELAEYHMLRFLPKERMSKFQKDTLEVLEDGNDD